MSSSSVSAFQLISFCFVCWYCKYGEFHRDLVKMIQERGAEVDPLNYHAPGASVCA